MATFRVASASTEYLAITGWGVDDVKLAKKAWVWLGQRCTTLDAAPASFELAAQGATSENFPVVLRAVCIVGPNADATAVGVERWINPIHLIRDKLLPTPRGSNKKLVEGVVEGRVRALAAGMTTDEIFAKGAVGFAMDALGSAQLELGKYGLHIYSATVKWLSVHVPPAPANNKVNIFAVSCSKMPGVGGVEAHCEAAAANMRDMVERLKADAAIIVHEASVMQQQAALMRSKMPPPTRAELKMIYSP